MNIGWRELGRGEWSDYAYQQAIVELGARWKEAQRALTTSDGLSPEEWEKIVEGRRAARRKVESDMNEFLAGVAERAVAKVSAKFAAANNAEGLYYAEEAES